MNLETLQRNVGVLPMSPEGFANVLSDLDEHRDLEPEGFLDGARYAIRAVGALLPPELFSIEVLADVVDLGGSVSLADVFEVVEATGEYEGEVSSSILRAWLGLIDDGVRPTVAGKFLRMDEDEVEILSSFLDVWSHWETRLLDKIHVLVLDGGGVREIQETFHVGRFTAWRLARRGRAFLNGGRNRG